jgi:hypothetical protein
LNADCGKKSEHVQLGPSVVSTPDKLRSVGSMQVQHSSDTWRVQPITLHLIIIELFPTRYNFDDT